MNSPKKNLAVMLLLLSNAARADHYSGEVIDDDSTDVTWSYSYLYIPSAYIPYFRLPPLPPKAPKKSAPPVVNYSNGSEVGCKAGLSSANPVMLSNGEKYKKEIDFVAGSLYGFGLERTYRSAHATGKLFGSHWLSTLDPDRLEPYDYYIPRNGWARIPRFVTLIKRNGIKVTYQFVSAAGDDNRSVPGQPGKVDAEPPIPDASGEAPTPKEYFYNAVGQPGTQLTYSLSRGWVLDRDQKTFRYSHAFELQRVVDYAGNSLTYNYVDGKLEGVRNGAGQSVHFTWGGNGLAKRATMGHATMATMRSTA